LEAPFTDLAAVCEDRLAIKEALNLLGFAGQRNRYLSRPNSMKDKEKRRHGAANLPNDRKE
jgi:hypothetical protein